MQQYLKYFHISHTKQKNLNGRSTLEFQTDEENDDEKGEKVKSHLGDYHKMTNGCLPSNMMMANV